MTNAYLIRPVSQMPPTLLAKPKPPYNEATCELYDDMAEDLADWIRSTRYRIQVREPEVGEIVRIQPECPTVRNWLPFVTDDSTGEAFRVSHDVVLRTHGEFQDRYEWMKFAQFITENGELALWPLWSSEIAQAVDDAPDAWVRVLYNHRHASITFGSFPILIIAPSLSGPNSIGKTSPTWDFVDMSSTSSITR